MSQMGQKPRLATARALPVCTANRTDPVVVGHFKSGHKRETCSTGIRRAQ
jgi:hypothetical protein